MDGTHTMIPDRHVRQRIASRFSRRGDRFYIHGKLATDPVYSACAAAIGRVAGDARLIVDD